MSRQPMSRQSCQSSVALVATNGTSLSTGLPANENNDTTSKYSTDYNQLPLNYQANQQLMLSTARVLISKQCLNLVKETIEKKAKEEK